MSGINYNRGVVKRTTTSGVQVCEYKDEPGTYYNTSGEPVEDELAKLAGFDVVEGQRSRRRRELEAEAQKNIEAQLAAETGAIEDKIAEEFDDVPTIPYVKRVGHRYSVFDAQNKEVANELTKKEANTMLEEIRAQ
jgi:hypothetical protein